MRKQIIGMLEETKCPLEEVRSSSGYLHVRVPRERAIEVLLGARQRCGMKVLQLISAVDRIEEDVFQLTWILESSNDRSILMVSADYPREDCSVPSLGEVWPAAVAFERELREMFGIVFPGNSRQEEDFLLEGWREIPPMRRDFDTLEYSIRTFGQRRERNHTDPREYIAEMTGEWDTPVPMKKEDEK